jgi:hypothetical protein
VAYKLIALQHGDGSITGKQNVRTRLMSDNIRRCNLILATGGALHGGPVLPRPVSWQVRSSQLTQADCVGQGLQSFLDELLHAAAQVRYLLI